MTEKARVRLSWGGNNIPVQRIDGAREALSALFGYCPPFEAGDVIGGEWLVELPAEFAGMLNSFGFIRLDSNHSMFTLTARKEI
ncbi:hypothetical protein SMD20_34090 [Nonomuraea sp. LP-02]|uniref:hypothetical protein n=1 Tax=Nonomuraea sp. LP-02 TaxID=3097960 RepID=UPI002E3003D0|nr:hypothetical protein [Nonomuraea sp. LP-02]MED7929319.1 hypothetical protein [Nonomuraea sp. LP-02]